MAITTIVTDYNKKVPTSKISSDNPWTTYVPTYGALGSMTYTSVTTRVGNYVKMGRTVFLQIGAIGTTGGSADPSITFTLPPGLPFASGTQYYMGGACHVVDTVAGNLTRLSGKWVNNDSTTVVVQNYAQGNWNLGANREVLVGIVYETTS